MNERQYKTQAVAVYFKLFGFIRLLGLMAVLPEVQIYAVI